MHNRSRQLAQFGISERRSLVHIVDIAFECIGSNRLLKVARLFSSFAIAAHDLDFVRLNRDRVLHLECHILDQEGPDFIAETVCIKVALDGEQHISLLLMLFTLRDQAVSE